MKSHRLVALGAAMVTLVSLAVVGAAGARPDTAAAPAATTKVTLQLKWVTQAQFAGYYAAKAKGYYTAAGLDVNLKSGGPDITPEQVVASGQAEFGIDWLPSLLSSRDKGSDLVNIAQVFNRSGMTQLTWKDSGITSIPKMRGKKVGNWLFGNEFELFAALVKAGMDPTKNKGVTIVQQPFDMNLFLQRKIDSASAMTYNELAQVLESKNPKTKQLYQLKDLNVITMESAGTAMLEDGIFVRGDWIKSTDNQATAKKFLEASFQGWAYCRDHLAECTQIVLKNSPILPKGHQRWMMNEINAITWPAPLGVGVMNQKAFTRTASISRQFGVIKKLPKGAYRTDLAKAALKSLRAKGVDVNGANWKKANVKVTAGGK
ncbi:MAG: NitT/TauT family transport system substrate-binding protein [Gaiellaceae bacterium]|jgi:NitT/TauT family transport system substrate-binding protein|nr:NitT/TauT family transport system substrate-binding protein [Gaiellaceae bacterium]